MGLLPMAQNILKAKTKNKKKQQSAQNNNPLNITYPYIDM
jgi:hypothetical protein